MTIWRLDKLFKRQDRSFKVLTRSEAKGSLASAYVRRAVTNRDNCSYTTSFVWQAQLRPRGVGLHAFSSPSSPEPGTSIRLYGVLTTMKASAVT